MSRGFEVICADCQQKVAHHCHSQIEEAVVRLLTWVPESGLATAGLERAFFAAAKEFNWDADKDSFSQPIFGSQAWSYPLLGVKDTARSFHGVIETLVRALGFDSDAIMTKYYAAREAREKEEAERRVLVKKRKAKQKLDTRYMKGPAPLAKRKARLEQVIRDRVLRRYKTLEDLHEDFNHFGTNYLKNYYEGGINARVNKEVIEALRAAYVAAWTPPPPTPPRPEVGQRVRQKGQKVVWKVAATLLQDGVEVFTANVRDPIVVKWAEFAAGWEILPEPKKKK